MRSLAGGIAAKRRAAADRAPSPGFVPGPAMLGCAPNAAVTAVASIVVLLAACGPSLPPPRRAAPIVELGSAATRAPHARIVPAILPSASAEALEWSPDSRYIAILDLEGALAIVEAASGAVVLAQRASHGAPSDRALAWDASGERLVWDARSPLSPGLAILALDRASLALRHSASESRSHRVSRSSRSIAPPAVRPIASAGEGTPGIATPHRGATVWIESRPGGAALIVHDGEIARTITAIEPPPLCGPASTGHGALVVCEGPRVLVRDRGGALAGAAMLPRPARSLLAAGGTLAVLDRDGAVHLLEARDARVRAAISAQERRPDGISLSHDGARLAVWSRTDPSGRVTIYDAASGRELARAVGDAPIWFAVATSDGAHLVAIASRGALVVRGLTPGAASVVVPCSAAARIARSPDERSIAVAEPSALRVIDRASGDVRAAIGSGASEPALEGAWLSELEGHLSVVAADRSAVLAWAPGRAVVRALCRGRPDADIVAPDDALRWVASYEICDLRCGVRSASNGALRPSPDGRAAVEAGQRTIHVRDLTTARPSSLGPISDDSAPSGAGAGESRADRRYRCLSAPSGAGAGTSIECSSTRRASRR